MPVTKPGQDSAPQGAVPRRSPPVNAGSATPVRQVSVMTTSQVMPRRQSIPVPTVPVQIAVETLDGFEWPAFLKTIAELADPMQSEIVKGWLQSDLHAPN